MPKFDPSETPWFGQAHPKNVGASFPTDVIAELELEVEKERQRRGRYNKSAALREAIDLWLYSRKRP